VSIISLTLTINIRIVDNSAGPEILDHKASDGAYATHSPTKNAKLKMVKSRIYKNCQNKYFLNLTFSFGTLIFVFFPVPYPGGVVAHFFQGISYCANSGKSFLPYRSREITSAWERAPVKALCGIGSSGIPQ